MASLWRFVCYTSPEGVDDVRAAYDGVSKRVQAKFQSRLRILAQLPYEEWVSDGTLAKDLRGNCSGLREIRFLSDNVQHRPIGFRSGDDEFTIVFWAREKGCKFEDRNTCEKSQARKKEILEAEGKTNELWFALE